MRLIKLLVFAALVGGFVWFGMNVKLGQHTLFGHIGRIWKTQETQDLVNGTKEAARPVVEKVKETVRQ